MRSAIPTCDLNILNSRCRSVDSAFPVCRICFATDCKLYTMTDSNNLDQAYQTLTGLSLKEERDLPRYLCVECSRRLLNCTNFRSRSLRAHSILIEAVKKHNCITLESIKSVIGSQLTPKDNQSNHYDLQVKHVNKGNIPSEEQYVMGMDVIVKLENNEIDRKLNDDNTVTQTENPYLLEAKPLIDRHTHKIDDVKNAKDTKAKRLAVNNKVKFKNIRPINSLMSDNTICKSGKGSYEGCPSRSLLPPDVTTGSVTARTNSDVYKDRSELRTKIIKLRKHKTGESNIPLIKIGAIYYQTIQDVPNCNFIKRQQTKRHFDCHACHYRAGTESELTRHAKSQEQTSLACDRVSWMFKSVVTDASDMSPCEVFEAEFNDKERLQTYNTRGRRQFTCDICLKKFKRKSDIENHYRIHVKSQPYSCKLCNKKFIYNVGLKRHKIRAHAVNTTPY